MLNRAKIKIIMSVLLIGGLTGLSMSAPAFATAHYTPHLLKGKHQKVCNVSKGGANCFAQVVSDNAGKATTTTLPAGYGPTQFHGAYQLPNTSANPSTIAVVDAYDAPNVTADLAKYNTTFGLPTFPSCSKTLTTACFMKVNQKGTTSYPARNAGWALETSLDVETAHQTCQNCKLILVEATNANYSNLMTAVDQARLLGATAVSNSYGSSEFNGETSYDPHFNYPGIAFLFSSGDNGYGASYPAASPYVTAVGGTSLNVDTTNAWQSETVWSGTGSGCSAYESRPVFQADPDCLNRTIADVAADADPNTGAAVYDSYAYQGHKGWFQVGGTSLAAPLIAGIYGLTNNTSGALANSFIYAHLDYTSNLHDIAAGSNGSCGTSLCQAGVGYDGPTGLGSPEGPKAF